MKPKPFIVRVDRNSRKINCSEFLTIHVSRILVNNFLTPWVRGSRISVALSKTSWKQRVVVATLSS